MNLQPWAFAAEVDRPKGGRICKTRQGMAACEPLDDFLRSLSPAYARGSNFHGVPSRSCSCADTGQIVCIAGFGGLLPCGGKFHARGSRGRVGDMLGWFRPPLARSSLDKNRLRIAGPIPRGGADCARLSRNMAGVTGTQSGGNPLAGMSARFSRCAVIFGGDLNASYTLIDRMWVFL